MFVADTNKRKRYSELAACPDAGPPRSSWPSKRTWRTTMNNPANIEVPETFRKLAEQNVSQARKAYEQFMTMARQAQDMMNQSSGAMTDAAREVQSKALGYAEKNMEAGFAFVGELARSKDLKDFLEIQSKHTQKSMQTYKEQAEELGRLIAEASKKSRPNG
jgi:phasin